MKIKTQIIRYCQNCDSHMYHLLKKQKGGKASKMNWIERQKSKRTRGNRGKFDKTPAKRNKVKRPHIRANCITCDYQSFLRTRRANKLEFMK